MPGLNQLKKFSEEMKNIGNEEKIRIQRGEKPVSLPLPKGISEENDTEDFVLGLESMIKANEPAAGENAPEDDASNLEIPENTENSSAPETSSGGNSDIDLSSLLNFSNNADDSSPDLSDFIDEVPAKEEPEETPLEDLDLESLLKPAEESEEPELPAVDEAPLAEDDFSDITSSFSDASQILPSGGQDNLAPDSGEKTENLNQEIGADIEALLNGLNSPDEAVSAGEEQNNFEEEKGAVKENETSLEQPPVTEIPDDFFTGLAETPPAADSSLESAPDGESISFGDDEELNSLATLDTSNLGDLDSLESADSITSADFGDIGIDDALNSLNSTDLPDLTDLTDSLNSDEGNAHPEGITEDDSSSEDENAMDFTPPELEMSPEEILDYEQQKSESSDGNIGMAFGDGTEGFGFSPGDFPDDFSMDSSIDSSINSESSDSGDFSPLQASDSDGSLDSISDDSVNLSENTDGSLPEHEIPDGTQDVPPEFFDVPELDSVDFESAQNNDSSLDTSDEFPVTGTPAENDEFELDDDDFEIPGFSDTQTANFQKKKKSSADAGDFSKTVKDNRPPNTLTDEEYEKFKQNLLLYPLNLRLVIEDLIVKNEFTDESVFEVITLILKKTPARQLATHLEKMLDISISVPRDYEKRSVEQYEAYKQSFQYQLKNRIIPGGIMAVILCLIGFCLFRLGVMFIYKPVMANMLYKQGYTLLENSEYPQSEEKFIDAVKYKPVKKWFFRYAQGYSGHKQYERAAQMYRNILGVFNHDKTAGLEWAQMELDERSNYERAEEIVRRHVLDYHINLPEGILLLGDIFLEWAEYEPEKYELARQQYSSLINLYGATDLYMSRMMRYFIRTDSLRNVLEMKNRFYPNEKSLEGRDWTELSGYLLEKLYGPLNRSDEYLRSSIEDVRAMLEISLKKDGENPVSHYNMARYFVENGSFANAKYEFQNSLKLFDSAEKRTRKNVYREINSYRLLGELYAADREYLKAQETYTSGISVFKRENEMSGLEGDENTGKLYADLGDIEYFVSGDMDAALEYYETAARTKQDTPSINYRIGAIRYGKNEYDRALNSFIKAHEEKNDDKNLLLALGNTLAVRNDNFASQGYYTRLLSLLDTEKARHFILFPQEREEDNEIVDMYLRVSNNLGVALYRIAKQMGDSAKNAEALVKLSDSVRAWDALTRNPETMVRLEGSNLAAQNLKYITHPNSEFEPSIYTEIPKTLENEKVLE